MFGLQVGPISLGIILAPMMDPDRTDFHHSEPDALVAAPAWPGVSE